MREKPEISNLRGVNGAVKFESLSLRHLFSFVLSQIRQRCSFVPKSCPIIAPARAYL